MQIKTPNGNLMIDAATEIPMVVTNPLFNDQGSHSLPLSIPGSDHNHKMLGFPLHANQGKRTDKDVEYMLDATKISEQGVLRIINAENNQIEVAMLTREGAFWEWAKKTNLRNITIPHANGSIDISPENLNATLGNYIDDVWPDVDFAFFPIATDFISLDNYANEPSYNLWATNKYCISDYVLWNNPNAFYRNDGLPSGSLVSPFVYLNAALQWVASSFGYRINENYLASTDELKSAVVLNKEYNTTLVGGYNVVFSRLLPNVPVIEFIEAIEGIFNCKFYIDSKNRTVNIKSFNECKYSTSNSINGRVIVKTLPERKSLKLSASRVSSPYISVETRAIDNFLFTHDEQDGVIIDGKVYHTLSTPDYINYPQKIVFSKALQAYFYYQWVQGESDWDYTATCIHSNFYDRTINSALETESLQIKAQLVPMIPVTCRQFYKNGESNAYFTFDLILPFFSTWDWLFKNENGVIGLDDQATPISFAFNRGRIVNIPFGTTLFGITNYNLPWGSIDVYAKDGTKINDASIALRFAGDYSLYDNFYKEYEKFLNDANQEIELIHVDEKQIFERKIYDKLNCDGLDILIDTIKFTVTPFNTYIASITGRSLKPLLPS